MPKLKAVPLGVVLSCFIFGVSFVAQAKTLFEDDFSSGNLDRYILSWGARAEKDVAKNAKIKKGNPPKHGPDVLVLDEQPHDTNLLAIIKNLEFTDGFIEVLWLDSSLPEDADGPFFFHGQLDPKDPKSAFQNCYLVELDTDTGLHFAAITGGNENIPDNAKAPNLRSTGNWTWIKMMAKGPDLKVKSWEVGNKEPDKWAVEFNDKTWDKGVVGFRSWSGTAEIAYIVVSDLEGPRAVDAQGKLTTTWGFLKTSF